MVAIHGKVARAAVWVALFSVASRLLGLLRDRLLSTHFGAGQEFSAYLTAFTIPDVVFNLVFIGALSSAFIPIFTGYLEREQKQKAWEFTSALLSFLLVLTVVLGIVLYFILPFLTEHLLAVSMDAAGKELVVNISRLLLLGPLFFGLSNIATGVLNSYKKFIVAALPPLLYNLGIILGVIFLSPRLGIYGVAVGVLLGAALHFIIQLPSVIKLGYRFKLTLRGWKDKGVKKVFKLMGPRLVGLAAQQINILIGTIIANTVTVSALAIYRLADNVQSVVYSTIGISLSTAAFPFLTSLYAQDKANEYIDTFSKTLRKIIFLVIPLSALIIVLRAQIVRVLFGAGRFDWEDTTLTASVLGYFAIGILARSLIPLLSKSFYACHNTRIPVVATIIGVGFNVVGCWFLSQRFGVAGLAMSDTFSAFLTGTIMLAMLHARYKSLQDRQTILTVAKIVFATAIMILVVQGLTFTHNGISFAIIPGIKTLLAGVVDMQRFWGVALQAGITAVVGLAVYLLITRLIRLEEAKMLLRAVRGGWRYFARPLNGIKTEIS